MKSKLAENLIRLRKKKGLSQKKLAELAGVTRGTIAYYEKEESVKLHIENIYSIAKVLGVKIEDLLDNSFKDSVANDLPKIDSRTMEKIKLIISLPRGKRHMVYTMVEALTEKEKKDNNK